MLELISANSVSICSIFLSVAVRFSAPMPQQDRTGFILRGRLIEFGRYVAEGAWRDKEDWEAFDFLDFTCCRQGWFKAWWVSVKLM
jgi:hypothetical protein